MQDPLIEVTPDEMKKIYNLVDRMTMKWSHRTATRENLQECAYEITSRALDMGFIVNVDVTPALVGVGPFDVALIGRSDPSEPDHERIRYQIKKQYKEQGKI